ncbi:hypothetical protein Tco_0990216 [Tanacetum coccineum]|uniref:Uncharacterized protein n=1 Tax=Tanacetum coccineum TaxID=301880 RepID=A0ABQ5EX87_9ASTR
MILILKTDIMDPVMQCTILLSHSESLKIFLFHFSRRSTRFYRLSHSEIFDIEKVAVRSSLRLPNNKCALIESYALSWKPYQGDSLNLPDHRYNIYTIKRETGGLDDGVAASFQRSQDSRHHAQSTKKIHDESSSTNVKVFRKSLMYEHFLKRTQSTRLLCNSKDTSYKWIKYYFFYYVVQIIMLKEMLREIVSKLSRP